MKKQFFAWLLAALMLLGAAAMADNYNNYCPTPYPEGSDAYNRVLAKLSGTYEAASQGADYSNFYASWG